MEKLLYHVGALTLSQRSAVEAIVGHSLRDDQKFYLVPLDQIATPSDESRNTAWSELEVIIAEAHDNIRHSGIESQELEQIIDDSCNAVRYGE